MFCLTSVLIILCITRRLFVSQRYKIFGICVLACKGLKPPHTSGRQGLKGISHEGTRSSQLTISLYFTPSLKSLTFPHEFQARKKPFNVKLS